VDILRTRCSWQLTSSSLSILEKLEALCNGGVTRIQLARSGIGIDGVSDLVIATFIQATEIEPHFGNVWINADGSRIGVEGVTELVNLEVQDSDRTPEGWVASISVDCLLVCLVGFVILLTRHISATEKIPALGISRV